ncbi:uncharacterized protein LOC120358712 [Solenopsis invicta]|uniref:uncharacterized protein LOC120358712 n=1 Tax=Solenopsis invicta TaxID=13686 RepID=UPI00193EB45A|nr:uncharacterized protein LOC120358712 [Solenopsis invicta]
MTTEFAVKRTLAVRICRELEFCDTNACIRKCCPEDTYTYEGDCIRLPVPNELGEFHNALANAVNQTNTFTFDTTKGYGVLIQFPCEVMHHTWDPNDWEEYMLLTSNGHVFILNHDTNDRHCFDVMHNEFDNSSYFDFFV